MMTRRSFPVSLGVAAAMALGMPVMPTAFAAPPAVRPTTTPPAGGTPSPRPPSSAPPGGTAALGTPATATAGAELSGDEGGALGRNSCRKQPRGAKFRITLPEEAELKDLVNWMMSISCQKFIWDPKVRGGKVTILSPEPVTVDEAYAAFYAALQTMGLTVEPSGKYFKIVESTGAESRTLPVYGPSGRAPANDRFVTQLIRPKSGNTADIVGVLNKLKSKQGAVETSGDLIILTDTGTSVRRLMKIINEIDDPKMQDAEKIFFFQLQAADPEETAETIREIFGEKDAKKGGAKAGAKDGSSSAAFSRVVVDERTGTLIVVAPEDDYQVIRRLIERLDVPLAGGGGRIHVYKLKNADPEEVANVLTQLGTGAKANSGNGNNNRRGNNRNNGGNAGAAGPAGAAELFSGEIKVTADPATRSLVILASTSDFKALLSVIEELDRPRKQVYIEVYLLELTTGNLLTGGAGAHFGSDFNTSGGQGLGFVSSAPTADQSTVVLSPSVLSGLAAGVIGPQVPNSSALLGTSADIPAFGVVIQALHELTDVNFVAEPHLYTADNHEASIEVGRNVPTPAAITVGGVGGNGLGVAQQSIQRQDVTLNVTVTPHINDGDQLTLDIEMENNDIESISETLGVTTTKRRLKLEQVVARDDQPVVLGGLMQEIERVSTSQVPGLGQIPLLGWLFKSKRREKTKVNLMMILVPHILETPDDVRRIHERRMKERLEFLERNTAFKRRDLDININYRKKSGLLSAVNAEAIRMSEEDVFRQQAEFELQQTEITGELGLSPSFAEEAPEPSGSSVSPATINPSSSTSTGAKKKSGKKGKGKRRKNRNPQ